MVELLRTDDLVMLGWLRKRLGELGIEVHIFDAHTSSLYGGAVDAIAARVMVHEEDVSRARLILAEAQQLNSHE
jgi:hypothetical protein